MDKINKKILNQCYSGWASIYNKDAQLNPVIIKDHPIIFELLKPEITPRAVGLDLGCGTCILTLKIASRIKQIIGLDISKEMIAIAKKRAKRKPNTIFKIADITQRLNFPNKTFDFVISSLTMCHIDDLEPVYKEIFRVLKPQGIFIFDEITSKLKKPFSPKHEDYLEKFGRKNRIWERHSAKQHLKLLRETGFKIEKIVRTKIDEKLKKVLRPEDYKANYGCHFTTVIKARKNV